MAEEQKKCTRCESGNPAKTYNPRTPGHPDKTVDLCDDCAAKDNKAVPLDNKVPKIEPAVPPESLQCKVTAVDPDDPSKGNRPIKESDEGFATEEHGPKIPEPISMPTPKSAPPVESKPVCAEPIERGAIRDKLAKAHKELDSAHESKQRLLAQLEQNKLTDAEQNKVTRFEQTRNQLSQVNTVINIKSIEIASYRGILGDEG